MKRVRIRVAAAAVVVLGVTAGAVQAGLFAFTDDFGRPDDLSLGPAWDEGFGTQSFGVENNAAVVDHDLGNPGGGGFALVSGLTVDASTGFALDVDMTYLATSGRSFGSIVFGYEDASNFWELRLRSDPGAIFLADLIQTAGGVEQSLTSTWDFAGGLSAGPLHLDVDYDGTNLSVTVNHPNGFNAGGTATQVDPVTVASGGVGLRSRAGERVYAWDNFSIDVSFPQPAVQADVPHVLGIEFLSSSGLTYRLQSALDLAAPDAFSDTGRSVVGDGSSLRLHDVPDAPGARSYRVVGAR